jgi:NAD-dependent SIR2 family protein deacetylase
MKKELEKLINNAEAIVIGAGAGLSAAAGFEYGGQYFKDNFYYMYKKYGYKDMYSAGFHNFDSLEDFWGYWAKFIFLERYENKDAKPLYRSLFEKIEEKNYFIITTNVDHQFQKAGFKKDRIFYMQGDYGLFQCSTPCHQKTYDNEEIIMKMLASTK